jgi:ubiquinone/menaquinone biosynthesis C-methylase UbiE
LKKGIDRKRYDRIAAMYDAFEYPMELLSYGRWRQELLIRLPKHGTLLEVGVGTGKNLSYYSSEHEVVAVDVSGNMLRKAKRRVERPNGSIHLLHMDVERLGFPDDTFDAAVSTFVFCSVENPIGGLEELRRVLRREGRAIFLEHMRSEHEVIGSVMDLMNPLVVNTVGANIHRRTVDNIRNAGFDVLEETRLLTSIFRIIVAIPAAS